MKVCFLKNDKTAKYFVKLKEKKRMADIKVRITLVNTMDIEGARRELWTEGLLKMESHIRWILKIDMISVNMPRSK